MACIGAMALVGALVAGCAGSGGEGDDGASGSDGSAGRSSEPTTPARVEDPALRDELLAMMEQDQSQGSGGDSERVERLGEILDEHGWPTYDLVGERAEDAAWVIAQHADVDLAFQKRALRLLRAAVADDQASPGNLAYLEDRVAVAEGRPQTYGTQVDCSRQGPEPSTPIAKRGSVDRRRAAADLEPLRQYYRQMGKICERGMQ